MLALATAQTAPQSAALIVQKTLTGESGTIRTRGEECLLSVDAATKDCLVTNISLLLVCF
jgi:hypothetical protein